MNSMPNRMAQCVYDLDISNFIDMDTDLDISCPFGASSDAGTGTTTATVLAFATGMFLIKQKQL